MTVIKLLSNVNNILSFRDIENIVYQCNSEELSSEMIFEGYPLLNVNSFFTRSELHKIEIEDTLIENLTDVFNISNEHERVVKLLQLMAIDNARIKPIVGEIFSKVFSMQYANAR